VLGDLSGEWLPFEEVYNGKELWVVKGDHVVIARDHKNAFNLLLRETAISDVEPHSGF